MQFREPLILPCLALMAGILAANYARFSTTELAFAMALFLAVAIAAHFAATRCVPFAWACCLCVVGVGVAEYRRPAPTPVLDAKPGESLLVSGCVVEPLSIQDGARGRFVVEIAEGARAGVTFRIDGEKPPPKLEYGALVEFPARVRAPRNYGNPGAFDYAGYLARRHTFWNATVLPRAEITRLDGRCGSRFEAAVSQFRGAALDRVDRLYAIHPDASGLMRALLLGDDDHLRPDTSDEFRRTGTYHALVISGLHISLIAGSLLWIMRRVFVPIWLRLVLSGLAAWAYTLIAGGQAPVMRAAVGFTLALVAMAAHRRPRVLNLLAAVAILFLLIDPGQLFEASFQLSFAAVAAIGGLASPLIDRSAAVLKSAARTIDYPRPIPSISKEIASLRVELRLLAHTLAAVTRLPLTWAQRAVAAMTLGIASAVEAAILSAAIQFALTAPAILYFHRVPLTSVLANLVSIPALNGAVGFGLSGLILDSSWLSGVAAHLARWAEISVSWCARLEPEWRSATPAFWLSSAFVAALAVLALSLRGRYRLTPLVAIAAAGLGVWMYIFDGAPGRTGWLEFAAIDVGQGDSLLIVFPEGETMLVDGGGFPSFKGSSVRRMDIGEQVVSPYLWQRGLRRLDVVVLTHAHDDHAQGLEAVIRNFHPSELWTGAIPDMVVTASVAQAKSAGLRIMQPRAGEIRRFGPATVRVLSPAIDYNPGTSVKNNDSLVLEITYGRRRFLLTGDAERATEAELVSRDMLKHTDVLKVGHHGSKTSTVPDLLAAIRPTFAIISAGEGNLYNHPHPDVLARMREFHVQTLRTDRAGLTRFRTDGNRLEVETNWLDWRAE